jgi:hypothetical protein
MPKGDGETSLHGRVFVSAKVGWYSSISVTWRQYEDEDPIEGNQYLVVSRIDRRYRTGDDGPSGFFWFESTFRSLQDIENYQRLEVTIRWVSDSPERPDVTHSRVVAEFDGEHGECLKGKDV